MRPSPPMFIVTGAPGAGKTSVARRLAQRFDLSLHIPVDELREWVVSGKVEPIPVLTPPAAEQLRLARETASQMAALYAKSGYAVVVDDVLSSQDVQSFFAQGSQLPMYKIFLCPSFDGVIARNIERYSRFDVQKWTPVIHGLYQDLAMQNTPEQGWLVLDTGGWSVDRTVDAILQAAGLPAQ